ncbi:MAG TPA: hypothetical protein VK864_16770 [Longimicrobiales bacterium]|nr:hypothetical protein [Longimicrobiales bacterium]
MRFIGLSGLLLLALVVPSTGAAQESARRVRVNVDYIAGDNLYISAGSAQGLFAGDTVTAFRAGAATALGRLVIVSSTKSRGVAVYAGPPMPINRGDALILEISATALARAQAEAQTAEKAAETPADSPATTQGINPRMPRAGMAVHGRIGLDVDALESTSQWGSAPEQQSARRFTNQAARVRLNATGLPGGARLITNLRVSYLGGLGPAAQAMTVRVYQASLEQDFTAVPLRLQLGRFYNPYESHSGYWDGALARVGSESFGVGVAAGYAPNDGNEEFSTARPKFSGFVDVHARNGSMRYDGDISVHRDQPQYYDLKREFVGVSQRLSWRGAFFTQRAQVGRTVGGDLSLWQLQATGAVTLVGPLQLNARYTNEAMNWFMIDSTSTRRERVGLGFTLNGSAGYASVEAGTSALGADRDGRSLHGSFMLPRALLGFGLGASGSYWKESSFENLAWSPSLERAFGRVRARASYQYSRTDYSMTPFLLHGADFSLSLPLPGHTEALVGVHANWGKTNSSKRVLTSIWKTF